MAPTDSPLLFNLPTHVLISHLYVDGTCIANSVLTYDPPPPPLLSLSHQIIAANHLQASNSQRKPSAESGRAKLPVLPVFDKATAAGNKRSAEVDAGSPDTRHLAKAGRMGGAADTVVVTR